jgi:hypothetical protein
MRFRDAAVKGRGVGQDARMEGRALDRIARSGWAWLLPAFGLGFGTAGHELFGAGRVPFAVAGLVLGAAWQLLYRRDVVDRLTVPTVLACLAVGFVLASGEVLVVGDESAPTEGVLLYGGGVLAGLVLAEQYLRRRDES